MKYVAILPLRSKSNRIKNKNIKLLDSVPLFHYQLQNALSISKIGKVIVSSDSEYYLELAKKYDVDTFKQSINLSKSDIKLDDVIKYVIQEKRLSDDFDCVILLQATSPLNESEYISEGIKMMETNNYNSIFSYYEDKRFFLEEDFEEIRNRSLTQDKKSRKVEAGTFWITKIDEFLKTTNRIISPYGLIKVPFETSLDVDELVDFEIAKTLLERKMRLKNKSYYRRRGNASPFNDFYFPKKDPDGVLRNFHTEEERLKRISSCKHEVDFINNLYCDEIKRNFLDVGCGLGFLSSAIDETQWNKFAIDPSKEAIEYAKKNNFASYFQTDVLKSDIYNEEYFDCVLCYHVIEHVSNPIDFIKTIGKIIKTHGHMIIGTPDFNSPTAIRFGKNYRMLHDKTHVSLFSRDGLNQLLEDLNFQINNIETPFFETEYFNKTNLNRLFDTSKISPPAYGDFITIYAQKR